MPPPPFRRSLRLTGKPSAKKGAADKKAGADNDTSGGAKGRRATVAELKGLVEVRAQCQAKRGGAAAVTGEGRPLLKVRTLSEVYSLSMIQVPNPPTLSPPERLYSVSLVNRWHLFCTSSCDSSVTTNEVEQLKYCCRSTLCRKVYMALPASFF